MNKELENAWAAGLFDGEGTFVFVKGKPRGISITSTDRDVLERFLIYGGHINNTPKRKSHYKDAYVWRVQGKDSVNFYNIIKDFLSKRRSVRGIEWIEARKKLSRFKNNDLIIEMFNQGLTHKQIADKLNLERSSITHFLNRRNLRRIT